MIYAIVLAVVVGTLCLVTANQDAVGQEPG